jgi:hypothetical protein
MTKRATTPRNPSSSRAQAAAAPYPSAAACTSSAPVRGTWAHAIACRDLAADLASRPEGQVSVPLFNHSVALLVQLLEAEHRKTEEALLSRFERKSAARLRCNRAVKPGDLVLCGTWGVSMPGDWFIAHVLWTDGVEMLTEHAPPSGGRQRNVWGVENAIHVGTLAQLGAFREQARRHVAVLRRKVDDAEQRLGDARRAVYDFLEALGAAKGGVGRP